MILFSFQFIRHSGNIVYTSRPHNVKGDCRKKTQSKRSKIDFYAFHTNTVYECLKTD